MNLNKYEALCKKEHCSYRKCQAVSEGEYENFTMNHVVILLDLLVLLVLLTQIYGDKTSFLH